MTKPVGLPAPLPLLGQNSLLPQRARAPAALGLGTRSPGSWSDQAPRATDLGAFAPGRGAPAPLASCRPGARPAAPRPPQSGVVSNFLLPPGFTSSFNES